MAVMTAMTVMTVMTEAQDNIKDKAMTICIELRQALIQIREQAKAYGAKRKDTEETDTKSRDGTITEAGDFFRNAQEKLSLAIKHLSSQESEDINLLSAVVFSIFSVDMPKSSSSSSPPLSTSTYQSLVQSICSFFISAYRHHESIVDSSLVDISKKGKMDILRALSALLFENGAVVKEHFPDLFRIIIGASGISEHQPRSESREVHRMALNCLANLVHKTASLYAASHEKMYEILYQSFTSAGETDVGSMGTQSSIVRRKDKAAERKLVSSALRALHFLLQEDKQLSTRSITPIMDVICRFMFYTSEHGSIPPNMTTTSSTLSVGILKRQSYNQPSNMMLATKTSNLLGPQSSTTDMFMDLSIQSSDSEYSDTESGIHHVQRRQHDGKVRLNALLCLQTLARTASKPLQPHWPKFLITSNTQPTLYFGSHKTPSLVHMIGSDPIPSVRSAACVVLSNIMEGSKQYLAMAEEKVTSHSGLRSQTGVMTLSERIGLLTRELHAGLIGAIHATHEGMEPSVVIPVIKCCSSVVSNCSYDRMKPGLSISLYEAIKPFLTHSDPACQATALSFVTTLLSNTTASSQVRSNLLTGSTVDGVEHPSSLVQILLDLIHEHDIILPQVRVEAWGALRAIAQQHFEIAQTTWFVVDKTLERDQNMDDFRIRSAGLLFLNDYLKAPASSQGLLSAEAWRSILEGHVLQAFAEDNASIKALGCDCVSQISSATFDALQPRLQMLILSLVLSTVQDESPVARSSACRTIGVFILFPSLREDSTHMLDMASAAMDLCHDANLAVRVRASWAVGNLCDSLVLLKSGVQNNNSNDDSSGDDGQGAIPATKVLEEVLTLQTWTRVMRTALMVSQDHEKMKSNGIRAIGGLLRVTFEGILDRERHSLVKDAINLLVKSIEQGSLKGRWNACYAIQNVLLNEDFPIGSTQGTIYACDSEEVSWTDQVYSALLHAIQHSRNFKVRINACAALSVPKTRAKYGSTSRFRHIVDVILKAVQSLDNPDQGDQDYGEFLYRDQLESKLLRCLDHLLQMAPPSSYSSSSPLLSSSSNSVSPNESPSKNNGGGTTNHIIAAGLQIDPLLMDRIVANRAKILSTVASSPSNHLNSLD
ncbi:HEAT repeat-containing protein 6 [Podila epigama]|nr:HEAT repeat-containing protein 6 [Podila epigama]